MSSIKEVKEIHVAVVFTHRIECLNLFLDILKNNFKNKYITHVFCNLSDDSLKLVQDKIDYSLIDFFHHFSDDCFMLQDTYSSKESSNKHKRIQPFNLFRKAMSCMSEKDVEKFIYTECDVFPVIEKKYIEFLDRVSDEALYCYHTREWDKKSSVGFVIPSPIYMTKNHSKKISEAALTSNLASSTSLSHEAKLMFLFNLSKIKIYPIGETNPTNSFFDKNRTKETETTHQHNIMNLDSLLREVGINRGKWVNQVLENEKIQEISTNSQLVKDPNFKISYCPIGSEKRNNSTILLRELFSSQKKMNTRTIVRRIFL
jgi:hypothetical protein